MTGTRGKRGVPRTLKALVEELVQLEKELKASSSPAAERTSSLVLERFPWDVLDARRRNRQNLALRSATEEMTRVLANVEIAKTAKGLDRTPKVLKGLQKLLPHEEGLFDLLEPVILALAQGGLSVGTGTSYGAALRKRLSGKTMMAFFFVLKDQMLDDRELIEDLAAGQGPRESAYRLLARVTGVGRTTIKAAAVSK